MISGIPENAREFRFLFPESRILIFVGNLEALPILIDTGLFLVRSSFVFRKFRLPNVIGLLGLYVCLSLFYLRF
jgi:hypothetical protein